jgi:hypothetical protein
MSNNPKGITMFNLAFWKTAAENIIVAFLTAFTGSLAITTTPSVKGLAAAGIAGGMAALYTLVKQLGGVQNAAATPKVAAK